jgi:hypothetical protein
MVGWRMASRCVVFMQLPSAVLPLEFMTFTGNCEQGGGREQNG